MTLHSILSFPNITFHYIEQSIKVSFMEALDEFFITYRLEIKWIVIIISAFQLVRRYLKRKSNRNYLRIQAITSVNLPLRVKPNWIMITLSLVFGITGLIMTFSEFIDNKINEALYTLGISLSLLIAYLINIEAYLSIKSEDNIISINDETYQVAKIKNVELWDDLIYFKLKDRTKVKFWLRFKSKNYPLALDAINLIEEFCLKNEIPVKNSFAKNIKENEVFNPAISTTK